MSNGKRLIEVAFPLKQTSIDSVHEKNVRHGHISTLHIWPARRPLAASRAALIATLLPDPGDKEKRDEILKRLGGTVVKSVKRKKLPSGKVEDVVSEETQGGILHWGRESGPDLDWFRAEIRKAYGGRAPKVLDPFAGGGAIPLEAMRLGCEVTAVDINPVAWFILKCTLEYPQKLAGQKRRLPDFALADREFMAAYLKALGLKPAAIRTQLDLLARRIPKESQEEMFEHLQLDPALLEADLAWHLRAWGRWVLRDARRELARFYPTYAEFCSLDPYRRVPLAREKEEQLKLVPTNEAGEPQIDLLNAGFDKKTYLDNDEKPALGGQADRRVSMGAHQ
jgi:adenine-specific DNA methylase